VDRAPSSGRSSLGRLLAVAACVVVVDHLTKWWATRVLDDRDIHLVGSFRLHLVENAGSAFSLGRGLGPFLGLVAVAVVIVLVQIGRVTTDRWQLLALALVLGGAVGNLTDRVVRGGHGFLHGRVVDFFDLQWWPVFNVADIAISIGAVLLVVLSLRTPTTAADAPPAPLVDHPASDDIVDGGPQPEAGTPRDA
jgi:signal peptidase II